MNFGSEEYSAAEILRVKVSTSPSNVPKLGAHDPQILYVGTRLRESETMDEKAKSERVSDLRLMRVV